jgi:hypothetical protein
MPGTLSWSTAEALQADRPLPVFAMDMAIGTTGCLCYSVRTHLVTSTG